MQGIRDAKNAGDKLQTIHIDKIVSSDLGRAFVSAYLISRQIGYTSEIELEPGFREINYGKLANTSYDDLPKINPDEYASYIFPDGESLSQMQDRVLNGLSKVARENDGKTVLIVGHDGTINSIRAKFKNVGIGVADKVSNAHDFVGRFQVKNDVVTSFEEVV